MASGGKDVILGYREGNINKVKIRVMKKKILHLHLKDTMGNMSTLICNLVDGSIKYTMYGGTGSSGTGFSLSNIQFYDVVDGNMVWQRDGSLPVSTLEGETLDQFKDRVINMLNNSTEKVVNSIATEVKFA